jgi:hypothetical protein
MQTYGYAQPQVAASAPVDARARFIVRTYNTLFLAILAFAAIEFVFFMTGIAEVITSILMRSWLLVLGAFMGVSWLASHLAFSTSSR